MYPDLPYPGYSWSMFQHMSKVNERSLFQLLLAAAMLRGYDDAALQINNYLIVNNVFTANVRQDSGQPDAWRDYQQILSALGLMFSTRYVRITPTPLGETYLDGALSFSDVMTLQAIRFQYPNGHNTIMDTPLKNRLSSTPLKQYNTLTQLQYATGVQIRPAILAWQVLYSLLVQGEKPLVTLEEFERYLMRCSTHADTDVCVSTLIKSRSGLIDYPAVGLHRHAQEWISFLINTSLFQGSRERGIELSSFSIEHSVEIASMCSSLLTPSSFWVPRSFDKDDFMSWYTQFGSLDLGMSLLPKEIGEETNNDLLQKVVNDDVEDDKPITSSLIVGSINLRVFDANKLFSDEGRTATTIDTSYSTGLTNKAYRTHDSMVTLIADICRAKGARVMDDPNSVDLLIEFNQHEFIVEVKSVTPRNFVARLRYAIGQVSQYGYLRSRESSLPCRRVIALTAHLPATLWCIPFLNNYLDIDLLSLEGQSLRAFSSVDITRQLFSAK